MLRSAGYAGVGAGTVRERGRPRRPVGPDWHRRGGHCLRPRHTGTLKSVLQIRMFLDLPNPDPSLFCTDPDPVLSINFLLYIYEK